MILTAIKLKLVALVAVAGLNTDDMKGISPEMTKALESLAADQKAAQEKDSKVDINASLTKTVEKVGELAKAGDPDANYALGRWALLGLFQNATAEAAMGSFKAAADKGHVLAKAELGGLMLQAYPQDPEKVKQAIKYIQEAETGGNNDARRALAQLTLQGVGDIIPASLDKAKALLEKGSAAGDGAATLGLSQLYAAGVNDGKGEVKLAKDENKALEMLQKAVEQGNSPAMSQLAALYFNGAEHPSVKKDPAKAITMFKNAADKGNAAANNSLGQIYENGLGEQKKNIEEAVKYYTAAANAGDAAAQFRVGNMLEVGVKDGDKVIVGQNPKAALDLYRISAQSGLAEANYNVGAYYEAGNIVDRDLPKSFAFFQRAAFAGLPQAQHKVGAYYQNGVGIGRDLVAGAAWYQRAADNGFALSQLVLGAMSELGSGVPQSFTAAANNYQLAAAQGMPLAMIRMASLYERGAGVKADLARAWVYAQQAVDASNKAKDAVAYLEALEKNMSSEQKSEAKKIYDQKKSEAKKSDSGAPAAAPTSSGSAPAAPTTGGKGKKGKNN
ncbi:MAG: sel1 repeat family protein [Verrucomicrobiaceae bacterium]|nr:sel1 repeat family protein [Verrucomicrobiaceae bacterium]